jgi:protein brassinosteroid insensitive 1
MLFLDLSFNQLDFDIPRELGNMLYLIIMNLGHNLLSGAIPAELGGSKKLSVLDLSHNQLEGPIPNSFSILSLSDINLSYNRLNGSIPKHGSMATFPGSQYQNNSGLCDFPLAPCPPFSQPQGKYPATSSNKQYYYLLKILLLAVTVAFNAIAFCLCYLSFKKKLKRGGARVSIDLAHPVSHQLISHIELVRATDNFSEDNMLGHGGFGKVFKGQLESGLVVAIKVLDMGSERAITSFDYECRVLRMVRHRNLIQEH